MAGSSFHKPLLQNNNFVSISLQSICLSVQLSIRPSLYLCTHISVQSVRISMHLCVSLHVYILLFLSVCRSHFLSARVRPSVRLYISLSVYLCLSVPLVTRISFVWLSVRLSTSLCASGWLTASLYTWVTDRARFNKIYKQFAASAFIMQYRLQFKALICMQIGLSHTYDKQIE